MAYRTLSSAADIQRAGEELSRRLRQALPHQRYRTISYPGDSDPNSLVRFESDSRADALWWGSFLSKNRGVRINLFGTNDARATASMNISFQFNYPLKGISRAQGGVFISDGRDLVLAHRGIMTRRYRVERGPLLRQMDHRVVQVEDDGAVSDLIVITPLNSPSLVGDLKRFGQEARQAVDRVVKQIKRPLQGHVNTTFKLPESDLQDYFDEFFGSRPRGTQGGGAGGTANCEHGAIVKALRNALGKAALKNQPVDLAVARDDALIIFEVKTAVSPHAVYTGLGQLLYHGQVHRKGYKSLIRCLVLPQLPDLSVAKRISEAMHVAFVAYRRQPDGLYVFEGLESLL